jgi:hypothetical protein
MFFSKGNCLRCGQVPSLQSHAPDHLVAHELALSPCIEENLAGLVFDLSQKLKAMSGWGSQWNRATWLYICSGSEVKSQGG